MVKLILVRSNVQLLLIQYGGKIFFLVTSVTVVLELMDLLTATAKALSEV